MLSGLISGINCCSVFAAGVSVTLAGVVVGINCCSVFGAGVSVELGSAIGILTV